MNGLLSLINPQMAGLLGQAPRRPAPIMADEGDEAFLRRYAQQGYEGQPMPAPVPARATPEQRRDVMGAGESLLHFLAGGTEGVHQTRERRRAELDRPGLLARQDELRQFARAMGPEAAIAFETNPQAFGESLGMQYRPVTTAEGSITSFGPDRRVAAPVIERFDDRYGVIDPLNTAAGVSYSAPRGATFSEETARINATNPVPVSPGGLLVDPQTGQPVARGLDRILAASEGTDLVTEGGAPLYTNTKTPAAASDPEAAARAREGRLTMADNLANGLEGSRRFADAGGVVARWLPWEVQDRANLESHLETLKGNLSFEKLMEMKANSPTGASGLGALSDREARMLASTVSALDADMSPGELERSFKIIDGLVAKLREEPASARGPVRVTSPEQARALPSGTVFITPDGQTRVRQ